MYGNIGTQAQIARGSFVHAIAYDLQGMYQETSPSGLIRYIFSRDHTVVRSLCGMVRALPLCNRSMI